MRKVKRFLACGLVLVMLFTMVPLNTLSTFAANESNTGNETDISESNVFDALGIDTSEIPEDVDLFSTDNPYGRDSYAENRVYEILVQDSDASTFLIGENNELNGAPDKVAVNKSKDTINNKNYIYTSPATDNNVRDLSVPNDYDNGVTKTIAGHFNNSKDAKKSDLATVAIDGTGNDANVYLYFSKSSSGQGQKLYLVDKNKNEKVGIPVGTSDDYLSLQNLEGLMHNYVAIEAGDYDGDGVDEAAVYVPKAGAHSIRVYDLKIDNTYNDSNADYYFTDINKWEIAWNYPLGDDINMVSLASGDFNHDGIDDLAVSYGMFISPRRWSTSKIKVFFGNRGERYSLFYSSSDIKDPKDPKNPQGPQNEVVRASVAARDLTEDGFPELIVGGNLKEDIQNYKYGEESFFSDSGDRSLDRSNLNSRYLAIYQFQNLNNNFDKLIGQNFNLFEQDDNNNWAYPCMEREPIKKVDGEDIYYFYSLPLLRANIAAVKFNGLGDSVYIYLDSLLFKYSDNTLKLVYTFEGRKKEDTSKSDPNYAYNYYGTYFDSYAQVGSNNIELREHHNPRFYMEYDIVAGDMTGTGRETAAVLLYAPPSSAKGILKPQITWIKKMLDQAQPNNDNAELQEYVSARFISINSDEGAFATNDQGTAFNEGSFFASVYNHAYKPGTITDGDFKNRTFGLSLKRSATIVLCDTDNDTTYLKYTGRHEVHYSDPRVLAVLASPPYFKDLARDDLSGGMMESETSYSSSKGEGQGSSKAVTISAGAYISFQVGDKWTFAETEASTTYGFTYEYAESSSMETSVTYATQAGQDTVVFYSIPVEVYYYDTFYPEIDSSNKIVYKQGSTTVNIPHTAAVRTISLEKYEKIAKDYPTLPAISGNVLQSVPGDPSSYPQSTFGLDNAIVFNGDWSGVDYGSGSSSQEISITKETEESYTHTVSIEFKAGGGLKEETPVYNFEVSNGIVGGVETEIGTAKITSVGSTYSGTICDLPSEAEPYGYYFAWKLLTYTIEVDGANIPVVTYLVTDVTSPPELPDDFAQDYSQTSSDKIGLTWSYPAGSRISKFKLYRYYDFPEGNGSYEIAEIPASAYSSVTYDDDGKAYYNYEYLITGLSPYTEYSYQIQTVRSSMPNESILSEVLNARTKPKEGEPTVTLKDVNVNEVPVYDSDGNRIGTKNAYSLLVYPDTVSIVSVSVTGKLKETPRYQWQKYGNEGWTDIKGATSAAYRFEKSGYATAGEYRCRVNSIYENELTGDVYYITTYSDVFTVEYSMRRAKVVSFAADRGTKNVSITLRSVEKEHYYAPTGLVIFRIEGQDFDQYYGTFLKTNTSDYTSTATLNLAGTDGPDLQKGAYKITAFYSGSRVFQALDINAEVYYVPDNDGGYILNIDKTSYYYGDKINVDLLHVYVDSENKVAVDKVSDGITYELWQQVAIVENYFWFKITRYEYKKIDPSMEADSGGSLKAKNVGDNYRIEASVGSDTIRSEYFRISKRPVTVGFEKEFYAVYGNANNVTSDDVKILEGNLAFDDTREALKLEINYYDQNNQKVNFNKDTLPGVYEVRLDHQENSHYNITSIPTKYHIVSTRYSLEIEAEKLEGEIVGTVELVTPSKVTLTNGTTTVAATTPTNNSWSAEQVIPGGMDLVFRANPQTGYRLVKWKVQVSNNGVTTVDEYEATSNIFTYKMLAVQSTKVTAVFDYTQYRFYYASNNASGGTVSPAAPGPGMPVINIKSGSVVQPGASLTFVAKPAPGYHFVEWMLSGSTNSNFKGTIDPETGESIATVTMGTKDTILTAVFERDNLTLTLSEGLMATYTVQNEMGEPVEKTGTGTMGIPGDTYVKITLKPGYSIESGEWYVNGENVGTGFTEYGFNITVDTVVEVSNIRPNDYNVTLSINPSGSKNKVKASINGTVTDFTTGPSVVEPGTVRVSGGSDLEFTAQPARGYTFGYWEVRDKDTNTLLKTVNDPVFTEQYLSCNIQITANFVPVPVDSVKSVEITSGSNGSLEYEIIYRGAGNEEVISGEIAAGQTKKIDVYSNDELNITAKPYANYLLRNWTVGNDTINNDGSNMISFTNITENMTVSARFIGIITVNIKYSVVNGNGGSLTVTNDGNPVGNGSSIANGGRLKLTAVPDSGKMVKGWTYNGEAIKNENGRPFLGEELEIAPFYGEDVNEFKVEFADLVQYPVNIEAANATYVFSADPENYTGKTADSGNTHYARQGSSIALAITPNEGYRIRSVTVKSSVEYPDEDGIFRFTEDNLSGNLDIIAETIAIHTVTITPQNPSAVKGRSLQLGAVVSGLDNPSQEVTWDVTGNTSGETFITPDGELFIAMDEEAETLTVTAEA